MPSYEHATPVRHNALIAVQLSLELWDIASVKLPALSKNTTRRPHPASALPMLRSSVPLSRLLRIRATDATLAMVQDGIFRNTHLPHPTSALPMLRSSAVPYGSYWDRYC